MDVSSAEDYMEGFSSTHAEARSKFRAAALRAGAVVKKLAYDDETASAPFPRERLFVDVALWGCAVGEARCLLVHSSGVHGVEGFSGSAIQVDALRRLADSPPRANGLAVALIHGVNAHGMREGRRWTAAGVDLNRNFLVGATSHASLRDESDDSLYRLVAPFVNPEAPTEAFPNTEFYAAVAYNVLRYGYGALKQAIAGGQYTFPGGLFFGGHALEPAYCVVVEELRSWRCAALEKACHIDVHTGLGPRGHDTLISATGADNVVTEMLACGSATAGKKVEGWDAGETSYRTTGDFVGNALDVILAGAPPQTAPRRAALVQEFGTEPALQVLAALRAEATLMRSCAARGEAPPPQSHPLRRRVRDAFYPEHDDFWKRDVLKRGAALFDAALRWLDEAPS
ncbi:hypothetical protein M885DRAFT_551623 [Pelagophyceae sp. CCMP2097]|nr:hypothetical protein M885DRAFT_551623 [Pelagophyceae sp. CCMP2097]